MLLIAADIGLGYTGIIERQRHPMNLVFRLVVCLAGLQLMLSLMGCDRPEDACDRQQTAFAEAWTRNGNPGPAPVKYTWSSQTETCNVSAGTRG